MDPLTRTDLVILHVPSYIFVLYLQSFTLASYLRSSVSVVRHNSLHKRSFQISTRLKNISVMKSQY